MSMPRFEPSYLDHAVCPACRWSGWGRNAPDGLCPLCNHAVEVPLYDVEALLQHSAEHEVDPSPRESIGRRYLNTVPQWKNVAWQLKSTLCESDYFFYLLYRRNWGHVETEKLTPEDWDFINKLGRKYGPDGQFVPLKHWASSTIAERQREALHHERMHELQSYVELLQRNNPLTDLTRGLSVEEWLAQWVCKRHPRLNNEAPQALFASQDGMSEVEHLLREQLL